jgi:HlyD family secretion protein
MTEMFRKKSLERLSTPDRLDQLLRIVKRRSWIPLLALGGTLVAVLVWSIVGRVPVTSGAAAILVHPREVRAIQAPAAGELLELKVRVGARVRAGDLLATLDRPDLQRQLEREERRLAQFEDRAQRLEGFSAYHAERERDLLREQGLKLEARIKRVAATAEEIRDQTVASHERQRKRLEETRRQAGELRDALQARLESLEVLEKRGDVDKDALAAARARQVANLVALAEVESRIQELDLRDIEAVRAYEQQMDLVADLGIQRDQLRLQALAVDKRLAEARAHRETDAGDIRRTIERLRSARDAETRIVADQPGVVLEVVAKAGATVGAGQRIASIAVEHADESLVALAYFPVAEGAKLRNGMRARISPVTVERQRFGSIVAEITDVSPYPVTAESVGNRVGSREVAKMLVGGESRIEVTARLQRDDTPSGFRWTSEDGPGDVAIPPGTTARVRVTTERRAPITLLMPALRRWLGLD